MYINLIMNICCYEKFLGLSVYKKILQKSLMFIFQCSRGVVRPESVETTGEGTDVVL